MYIYKTTNLINKKIYIGQCIKNIQSSKNYYGSGSYIKKAIKKYGKENFKKEILEIAYSKQELNELEIYYIWEFNSNNTEIGYNLTIGGEGSLGKVLSQETKDKISKAVSISLKGNKRACGYKHTEETKKIISETHKGKKIIFTEKHRKNLSKSLKGKKLVPRKEETKLKISKSNKNKKRSYLHKCAMSLNKLKSKEEIKRRIDDIYYILDNKNLKTNILLKNVLLSASIINRLKNKNHWSHSLTKEECENFIFYEYHKKFK